MLLHCEKSGLVGAYAALRQTAKAKATYQTAQQMLEDLIRSERSNAAMKEGLAAVEHELGKLSTSFHKFNSSAGGGRGWMVGAQGLEPRTPSV